MRGDQNTSGHENTFTGYLSGLNSTTGASNTFDGAWTGFANTSGSNNAFVGEFAGESNTIGGGNVYVGAAAGANNTIGYLNVFLGNAAGINNTTGNSDIYVGNGGCVYPCAESHTIRIGTQGNLNGQQNAIYVAAIYGSTVGSSGIGVVVDNNGQLGTFVSSRRFKEQIHDMGDSSSALMNLRPVTFLYKPEYEKGQRTLQYGLIAEEVAEVYPDLVAYEKDGEPYTVKYQYLAPMLLNEFQKQHSLLAAQQEAFKAQQQEIETLRAENAEMQQRLDRLERLLAHPGSH